MCLRESAPTRVYVCRCPSSLCVQEDVSAGVLCIFRRHCLSTGVCDTAGICVSAGVLCFCLFVCLQERVSIFTGVCMSVRESVSKKVNVSAGVGLSAGVCNPPGVLCVCRSLLNSRRESPSPSRLRS